jgi:hypothetical protein
VRNLEWQPIKTAPKDGTIILGFDSGVVCQMFWQWGDWNLTGVCWFDDSILAHPTYWMPLPAPPKTEEPA